MGTVSNAGSRLLTCSIVGGMPQDLQTSAKGNPDMIVIGIDPHESSITGLSHRFLGLSAHGAALRGQRRTAKQLLGWAAQWPDRRFAIGGTNGLGRGIPQIPVADFPSTLAMKVRVLSTGGGRKSDPADAFAVSDENQSTILRRLAERREDLGHERAGCSTACTGSCAN